MNIGNPYQSPLEVSQPHEPQPVGVWRQQQYLVAHRGATFPPWCVLTGAPLASPIHHVDLGAWGSPLLLPVTDDVLNQRRWADRWVSWGFVGSVTLGIAAAAASGFWVVGLLVGVVAVRLVNAFTPDSPAERLQVDYEVDDVAWIRGVLPQYLERLPECPLPPPS